jgi:hypothetical protein
MARKQQAVLCSSCDAPLRTESSYCPNCGRPTVWATHDERVAFEVRQWRASRAQTDTASGVMMLVRTEEGYAPARVERTDYVWDQPLHPERVNPRNDNPHATQKSAPGPAPELKQNRNGNGNGATPAPARAESSVAVAAPAEPAAPPAEPLRTQWVAAAVAESMAQSSAVDPTAGIAGPEGAAIARPEEVVVGTDPAPAVRQVRISRKAVAVGIALAVGLPLSGHVVDLSSSKQSGARERAAIAAAPIRPVPIVVAGSGFGRASADGARYAVVVANPNRSLVARNVTVSISLLDGKGRLVGGATERIAAIAPGSKAAVAGQTGAAGPVARLVSRVSAEAISSAAPPNRYSVRGIALSRSASGVVVRGIVAGPATRDAKVVAVYLDRAGRIVGGDFAYVDVPAGRALKVAVSSSGLSGVARAELYVLGSR